MDEESAVTKDMRAIHETRMHMSDKLEDLTREFSRTLENSQTAVTNLVDQVTGTAQSVAQTVGSGARIIRALQDHPWGLAVMAMGALFIVKRVIRARINV